ncbi:MAG: hypothetical protein JRH20_14705 [Deltaproteobacteria bacterium]|nr:hypothetical protein [Deltaproteobacteria bacterium]
MHVHSRKLSLCGLGLVVIIAGACGRTTTSGVVDEVAAEADCQNGIDDDVDGLPDCQDPDCGQDSFCLAGDENCGNGKDDDGDGRIDCEDSDCFTHPLCTQPGPENCVNRRDDDDDGLVDCFDPDCFENPACRDDEICDNRRDDDGDGLVDCRDPDCFDHPVCRPGREDCDNRRDDDGDGLVDCDDPDCFGHPACVPGQENCQNRRDDDGDGLVDCDDPDCFGHPFCGPGREICDNKQDDDGDGLIDCDDFDCIGHPTCGPGGEICDNNRDDDGDGRVDCADSECIGHPACPATEECTNLRDDDGDGLVDCDDPDCAGFPACVRRENCTNQRDDDGDGLVDCKDPDCFKHPACEIPGVEICNNGVDDDDDGAVDCDDDECRFLPICAPGKEDCNNHLDDDGDGAVDCDDPDCIDAPHCLTLFCKPEVDFGTVASRDASVTRTLNTSGKSDIYLSTCSVPGGGEVVAHFRLTVATDVKLSYEQLSGDHVFGLFRAGVGEACNANPVSCFDPDSASTGDFALKSLAAGDYYLFAEAFAADLEGTVVVTLSTQASAKPEDCKNGIDDDGDGAVDCADLDCMLLPECESLNCNVDVNLGTLVVGGPSKSAQVDTRGAGDDETEKCAAGEGQDIVIRFVMPEAAGVDITVQQNGWHVFGMHHDLGPGTRCTADTGSCFDTNNMPGFIIEYGTMEKGVYYLVLDALSPGLEGQLNLEFRAFRPRGPELCANGIDDDGDGLVDCTDPDCTGVVGCPGPVCSPEERTGPLSVGDAPVNFFLDTRSENNDQTVPCALGGGKDAVIEIELTEVSGLAVGCSQTGDQVLGLFVAGQPRDPCDENPINCADPKTGTLGCNFIFPNLQPGKYYLVVEAFEPGAEGTMQISLAATADHAQEICNNGIDDDDDGQIDCQDANCSTKPICQGETCTPEQKIDLIVKGGAVKNVAVTTTGVGDTSSTSCAQGGGEDAVVAFTLAERSNLQIEYAQFGNHVFAIFEDGGQGFACDAMPISCQASNGQATGKVLFSGVDPGEYYLVVEAVASGSEGSVVMQIAAQ